MNQIISAFWNSYFCRVYGLGTDDYFDTTRIKPKSRRAIVLASFVVVTAKDYNQISGRVVLTQHLMEQGFNPDPRNNKKWLAKWLSGKVTEGKAKQKSRGNRIYHGAPAEEPSAESSGVEEDSAEEEWEGKVGGYGAILEGTSSEFGSRKNLTRLARRPPITDP